MKEPSSENPEKKKKKKKKDDLLIDKEKAKLELFDPRGVQTLFRTLSRNHYNLLRMIDGKASIVLTVNSIIISLLMGALYIAPETKREAMAIVTRTLIYFSTLSMVLALFSMLPHRYFGQKYSSSGYKGSLYAANFARQTLSEFQKEFERIMTNGNAVYNEMIKDLYFLGRAIHWKQRLLWLSVVIFLVGLIGGILYSAINDIMSMNF